MTPFARGLADDIATNGPMSLGRWMARCNAHYYAAADPLGRDFITSPEISQVFGELIGLWAADLWLRAGSPGRVILADLGAGRGTLIADALRATRGVPGFVAAASVHSIETSPALRAVQAESVVGLIWHDAEDTLPTDAPLIVISNEFLDALPIQQRVRMADGWHERRIDHLRDAFVFVNGPPISAPSTFPDAVEGAIHERLIAAGAFVSSVADRLATQGGAALFVDYGHIAPALGDTLQAVRAGERVAPLAHPGEADLTAHVDFAAMADAARPHARVHGPTTQAQFLARLGIAERTDALARANPAHAAALHAATARLTAPAQMGALFHALAFTHPDWPTPAGF